MISLGQIQQRILRGEEIEKTLEGIDWKEFEEFVAQVFEKHEFNVFRNFRFKTKKRYEIDILAFRNGLIVAVDCKKWKRGRYKRSGLKHAVQTQVERINELRKFLFEEFTLQDKFNPKSTKFFPLIVSWFEEDLTEYKNVFVVPVWKLNQFLLSLSEYI